MGQAISDIREQAEHESDETKMEFEERLQILEKLIEQRLETKTVHILNGEKNDQQIDTGTVVSLHKMVYINMGKGEGDELKTTIHKIFSGDFISGLESVVELGAEFVLGNESMGEYETTDMFIVWNDNALLRCDAYYYRWNFVSTGVIKDVEGVTGCLLVKRVIDLSKTDPQVLTWAITRMADRLNQDAEKSTKKIDPEELIDQAFKVLEKVVAFQAKIKALEINYTPTNSV